MRKVAISLVLLTVASILILPFIHPLSSTPVRKQIPFVGMTMSYQVCWTGSPPLVSRIVTFYGDPSEPDYIWVRDSENKPDDLSDDRVFKIDIETLKIVGQEGYSEALFPTNLHVGDEVIGYHGGTVTIIGSQRMSVIGKQVDAWIASAFGGTYTMYYEKKTGIWLCGNVVWFDGDTLNSWTIHLVSTNVPMFGED